MLISTNSGLYSARPDAPRIPMAQAMDFFAEAGFEAVDVNFCGTIYPEPFRHEPILDGDWRKNLDGVVDAIRRNRLVISHTHVPFYNYREEGPERAARDEMMYRAIEATAYIGATYAVIHPQRDMPGTGETLVEETVRRLAPFNDFAREHGVVLCVENMFTTTGEQLRQIVEALDCCACWDVGHANLGKHEQYANMAALGSRLRVLHLHDNYGTKDDHSLPFLGTVDWPSVMRALRDIGYEGTFNYEVAASKLPLEMRMDHARYLVDAAKYLLKR